MIDVFGVIEKDKMFVIFIINEVKIKIENKIIIGGMIFKIESVI